MIKKPVHNIYPVKSTALAISAALLLGACTSEKNLKEEAVRTCEKAITGKEIRGEKTLDTYMRGVGACMLKLEAVTAKTDSGRDHLVHLANGTTANFTGPINDAEAWTLKIKDADKAILLGVGGLLIEGTWQANLGHTIGQEAQTNRSVAGLGLTEYSAYSPGEHSSSRERPDILEAWGAIQTETNAQLALIKDQI